ncbi:MAG: nucleotide sugar dehydrogenase, partial [Deltaproteobacteria bacterium]|nr:nucleotide sugar dehydrogenase [Deltaproteobacteria bacterium]
LDGNGKALKGARVLVLGVAYKKDIDDQRESPSLRIIQLLRQRGASVSYNDPHVPVCEGHRHYPDISMKSVPLTGKALKGRDLVLLVTDHSAYDYAFIARHARLIVDTRNAFEKNGVKGKKVFKA